MRGLRTAILSALALAAFAATAQAAIPSPPVSLTAKAGDAVITLTWKPPANADAALKQRLRYRVYAKSVTAGTALPANDFGVFGATPVVDLAPGTLTYALGSNPDWALFNGEPYWIAVRAFYPAVNGGESKYNPIVAATPFGRPGLPGIFEFSARDGAIAVSALKPGDTNGSPIIDYTITTTGGSCTATAAVAACTISGLSTGTYAIRICSRNAAGTSTACRTRSGIAVTSTADCGSAVGCAAEAGGSGGGAGAAAPTAASADGSATISVAAARVTRWQRALSVAVPVTATGLSALATTITASVGSRQVGTCRASARPVAGAATTLGCRLGAPARAALRRNALRLTIVVTGTPADGSAALTATRRQRAPRG